MDDQHRYNTGTRGIDKRGTECLIQPYQYLPGTYRVWYLHTNRYGDVPYAEFTPLVDIPASATEPGEYDMEVDDDIPY